MKILIIDIEAAPADALVWGLFDQNIGINQIIDSGYILCWSAKWLGKREVMYGGVNIESSRSMLKRIHALLDEADAVIHYNGSRYDIPMLHRDFMLAGLPPASPVRHIDLLTTVRRQFKFLSNKLDYVAQALGVGNKTRHKGMELWVGCMEGDEASWRIMERYNKNDVRLVEKVYTRVLPWIPNHPNAALYVDDDEPRCPTCASTHIQHRGFVYLDMGKYQRYQCQAKGCGKWSRGRTSVLTKAKKAGMLRGIK